VSAASAPPNLYLSFRTGITRSTPPAFLLLRRYNKAMKSRLWLVGLLMIPLIGCHTHPLADYRPLVQAGVFSGTIEQLKKLNVDDNEISQVLKLKDAHISDDTSVELISTAHAHGHPFNSAYSVGNLQAARYTEPEILNFAKLDKIDSISGDAVMLRLVGLSDPTVDLILQRELQDLPTLSSGEIGRLKNTGLTEKQILDRINEGMTDDAAEKEAASREAVRNHSHTDFVRLRGRKPR
jgi:hypothetical protein